MYETRDVVENATHFLGGEDTALFVAVKRTVLKGVGHVVYADDRTCWRVQPLHEGVVRVIDYPDPFA